jgi:hypothetical protein
MSCECSLVLVCFEVREEGVIEGENEKGTDDGNRYHHLNHYAIFGGGYRGGAVSIMKRLIKKYGDGG